MNSANRLGAISLLITISVSRPVQISEGGQSQEVLDRRISIQPVSQETQSSAFRSALVMAHAPGGFVTVSDCDQGKEYKFAQIRKSLREALDGIVSVDPRNRWEINNGAVNLVPVNELPTLLNARIYDFRVENVKEVRHALFELLGLSEVQALIAQLRLEQIQIEPGFIDLKKPGTVPDEPQPGIDVHWKNTTLRGALNAIARAHGSAVWSYQERHCNGRHQFRIDFVVQ